MLLPARGSNPRDCRTTQVYPAIILVEIIVGVSPLFYGGGSRELQANNRCIFFDMHAPFKVSSFEVMVIGHTRRSFPSDLLPERIYFALSETLSHYDYDSIYSAQSLVRVSLQCGIY